MKKPVKRHRVAALIYDRLALFELAIAVEVFGLPRPELESPWYPFEVCSMDSGPVRATGALRVAASKSLRAIDRADTMIVPGRGLARAIDWALANLDRTLSVADLARASSLSARTLARRSHDELAATPHQWLNRQRVLAAQERLERSDDSIEEVASAVGFLSAQTLRLHFRRVARTSPTAYRARFSTRARRCA